MDPGSLGILVPIVAMGAWAAVKVTKIKAESHTAGADPDTAGRLQTLEGDLGTLRQELSEVHERLDFAERLLAQRPPDRLDSPK